MKDIEKIVKNLKEIIEILEANKISDTDTPVPQEEMEEVPDIRYFNITDVSNILRNGLGTKYPLFVKDGNNSHHFIINYDIMKEFLYRDDVEINIAFALRDGGIGACAVFKPNEVTVHIGTTALTGKKEDGTRVEIRAEDWKKLCFARVGVRKISK